jgi:SAM-dependent methyltransferase
MNTYIYNNKVASVFDSQEWPLGPNAMKILERVVPSQIEINDYDSIADVFDEVMALDFHEATQHIRWHEIDNLCPHKTLHCLDLCCGTGLFLFMLAKRRDIHAFGIDISRGQIGIAKSRQIQSRSAISYSVSDILSADYPIGMGLVTINFDALNHLESAHDWSLVFKRVYSTLSDEGMFLFDINLPERLIVDWNNPEVIVKENITYVQLAHPVEIRDDGVVRLTDMIIFKDDGSGNFTKRSARIRQFALPLSRVLQLLANVGFSSVEAIAVFGNRPDGHIFNKNRAFIRACK